MCAMPRFKSENMYHGTKYPVCLREARTENQETRKKSREARLGSLLTLESIFPIRHSSVGVGHSSLINRIGDFINNNSLGVTPKANQTMFIRYRVGGGSSTNGTGGNGGSGGVGYNNGGNGTTQISSSPGGSGGTNTGGGAGANAWSASGGAAGGSGIVVIRYTT